jgi:hypothetical protein
MSLLLGYLASLFSTFVLAAATLGAVMSFTATNTHQRHQYSSQHKFLNKDISSKHRDHLTVARRTKDKSMAITADAATVRLSDLTKAQ